ncbi:coiled-coil domain-containing protein 87 [Xyrauchen texanus]|uniref:coiled-coil domain-containing protein 87 n=1 Tax=Xyrauchen texanus TaxID=154827 RepID=UPI0022425673|nr:coiled-coil domain-containing protein 87 [Xyrauchen texanus]
MTGEITSAHRFTAHSKHWMEHTKCEDLIQTMIHSKEVQQHFKNILRPLSLLIHPDKMKDRAEEVRSRFSAYEKNKTTPTSLAELCKLLEERISQISQLHFIYHEDQQALTAVLISELGLIWHDLKIPPVDITLTRDENVQLHNQTFSEVLDICEQLFLHYLHLMDTLRRRGVFSDYANRSRLAAQLASDCTNLLNVRSIKSRIVPGIKATRRPSAATQRERQQGMLLTHSQPCPRKHDLFFHAKHRMKRVMMCRPLEKTVENELKEIEEKIGELDLQRVYDLLPYHMEPIMCKKHNQRMACSGSTASVPSIPKQEKDPYQNRVVRMKGCCSMPDLQMETLLEELEIGLPCRPPSPLVLLSTEPTSSLEKHITPADDLRRLLQDYDDVNNVSNCETDLPPLIKAHTDYGSRRLQKLKLRLQEMMEEEEEKKKKKKKKSKILFEKPPHPQGAVVSVAISPQIIVQTAAARVSDRVFPETIKLSMYPPVYNDLIKEIDSASVMDRNFVEESMEIKKIYEELSKTIPTKYFNFDEDPRIEPILSNAMCCLKRRINEKLMNPLLRRERTERAANRKRPVDVTTRAYRAWFQWWKCQLSLDDYLNYISNQDSDYLSVLFHLYDSDDEEEERHKLAQMQKEERRRRHQERINSMRRQKEEFLPGFWNVNTIEMGGLGKEPKLDGMLYTGTCRKMHSHLVPNKYEWVMICLLCVSEKNPNENIQDVGEGPAAGLLDVDQMQTRLEKVWNALYLPEGQRIDMAIKYSSPGYRDHLQEAISAWEQAAQLIQQRELLLFKLEDFERVASNPNRFFQQGYHGSSMARMEEARQREKLNSQISAVDKEIFEIIGHITTHFNGIVTYKGRPYCEKIRWDRIEMLYWLQQERRVQSLEMFVEGRMALPVRLPPLNDSQDFYATTISQQCLSDCERNSQLQQHPEP